jgi:uncharacterized protein
MEKIFDHLKEQVKSFLATDGSWHDYWHAVRVFNSALLLETLEWGNKVVIWSAALVHDICRPREKKTGKSHFGEEALQIIRGVLDGVEELDKAQKDAIIKVVSLHDIYDRDNPGEKSIELQIVQDADNLDAIGALGIGRTFAFGGTYHLPMHDPDLAYTYKELFEDIPGQHTPTTIGHFYEKLLKLAKYMNTASGKQLAQSRHQFMEQFLEQFFAEREGER